MFLCLAAFPAFFLVSSFELAAQSGANMGYHVAVGIMYVLEVMFFLGLAGCAAVSLLSWIDILSDGFTKDNDPTVSE
jgi:hypothetical protein